MGSYFWVAALKGCGEDGAIRNKKLGCKLLELKNGYAVNVVENEIRKLINAEIFFGQIINCQFFCGMAGLGVAVSGCAGVFRNMSYR